MTDLRNRLSDRLSDRFFGSDASAILASEEMPYDVKQSVEANFITALECALSYLEQWFDFSDSNVTNALQHLSLKHMPTFQHMSDACSALKLTLDIDRLYDEFSTTKIALNGIVLQCVSAADKWLQFFKVCYPDVPPNVFQLVSMLSIPTSNAFPERIFSLMNAKCRQDRNRMTVALIKSELQVFANYNLACRDYYDVVLSDQKLFDSAASNNK